MSIDVQQFQISYNGQSANQQLQKACTSLQQKYTKTLTEFNSFKQSSILSYEKMLQHMQKNKTHNQQLTKKLQKKYENLLHQQRTKTTKHTEKLKTEFQKQRLHFRQIINGKNQSIQKLSQLLHKAQQQKSQIIEENTQNLINIVKSQQNCLQSKKYSHTQLMKMYQYLLEQNNCLKKQLMKVQLTQHQYKSNQKSKKSKNLTQILYTQQSDKIQSMYISSQNQSQLAKKKTKSKENSQYINLNASTIHEQSVAKASSTYKQKVQQNLKKNKNNLTSHVSDSSQVMDQNGQKRKQTKRIPPSSQNLKKQHK